MAKTKLILLFFLILIACGKDSTTQNLASFENLGLEKFNRQQLESDFDLLVSSLKEAHTGLYWYATETQFDSLVKIQKGLLRENLDGLQFYAIVAPIVAFSKEDHCDISLPESIENTLAEKGLYLPLLVVNLAHKPFLLNDIGGAKKGQALVAINGRKIEDIYRDLFRTFGSDGLIESSKYRYLDFRGFSREYAKVIGQQKENTITVFNRQTGKNEDFKINAVSSGELKTIHKNVLKENPIRQEADKPAYFKFLSDETALLYFNTFSNRKFENSKMNFKKFVDSTFTVLFDQKPKNLIIDMRDNGGGSEGNEDYLFSYLTDKPYQKYKYVQVSGLTFDFLPYTDYAAPEDRKELEAELQSENQKAPDGKYYRKPNVYQPEPLKNNSFKGQVYVLTSGWTYSGGAEFSTLMKEHTNAIFVGEETGGGYYGNTSGTLLELTLPHTKLTVEIPILKFALDVRKGKTGRGVIPDAEIQATFEAFISGRDVELEFAKMIIARRKKASGN